MVEKLLALSALSALLRKAEVQLGDKRPSRPTCRTLHHKITSRGTESLDKGENVWCGNNVCESAVFTTSRHQDAAALSTIDAQNVGPTFRKVHKQMRKIAGASHNTKLFKSVGFSQGSQEAKQTDGKRKSEAGSEGESGSCCSCCHSPERLSHRLHIISSNLKEMFCRQVHLVSVQRGKAFFLFCHYSFKEWSQVRRHGG